MKPSEISTKLIPGQTVQIDQKRRQIVEFIQKNCTQAIDAYRKTRKPLYRGINGVNQGVRQPIYDLAFVGQSTLNRQPKDTSSRVQKKIDRMLKLAGFKAFRGNSIFCVANRAIARAYSKNGGKIYMIFPIDGFDFTWSPKISDLYIDMHLKMMPWLHKGVPGYIEGPERFGNEGKLSVLQDFIENLNGTEYGDPFSPQEFVQKYQFKNTDFPAAVKSRNEVLIHGNYVAVESNVGLISFERIVGIRQGGI